MVQSLIKADLAEQLPELLRLHAMWVEDLTTGKRLNLVGANLIRADLTGATLIGANL